MSTIRTRGLLFAAVAFFSTTPLAAGPRACRVCSIGLCAAFLLAGPVAAADPSWPIELPDGTVLFSPEDPTGSCGPPTAPSAAPGG